MATSAVVPKLIQPLRRERALLWGLLGSIALHALVFLGLSLDDASPPVKALLVLTARLAPIAPAPPPPAPTPQPEAVPLPAIPPPSKPALPPRPVPDKPAAAPSPSRQKTAPVEAVKAVPPESASAAPARAAPSTQSPAPVQARAAPRSPATAPATEPSARSDGEVDAKSLEQYRLALILATRRYKRYPAIALEKGWHGRVEVHMVIGANGMMASTSIKSSSGHEVLDDQALDMLKKGKTTIQIPAGLRGREFAIDVPVIFNLESPNS